MSITQAIKDWWYQDQHGQLDIEHKGKTYTFKYRSDQRQRRTYYVSGYGLKDFTYYGLGLDNLRLSLERYVKDVASLTTPEPHLVTVEVFGHKYTYNVSYDRYLSNHREPLVVTMAGHGLNECTLLVMDGLSSATHRWVERTTRWHIPKKTLLDNGKAVLCAPQEGVSPPVQDIVVALFNSFGRKRFSILYTKEDKKILLVDRHTRTSYTLSKGLHEVLVDDRDTLTLNHSEAAYLSKVVEWFEEYIKAIDSVTEKRKQKHLRSKLTKMYKENTPCSS